LVTGVRADEHGLLVNGTIVRTGTWPPVKVDPNIDKIRMVHVPTVYDAAHDHGLTTAQVDWVAINTAPSITWAFPEWASPQGSVEQEMIRAGVITASDVQDFTKFNILWRDQIWTKAAAYLIREHKPNLLLVHLLSLDSVHHQYGPRSLAATSAIAFLDGCVDRILTAVREAGMQDRATVFVVADHGFKAYNKQIRLAVALRDARLADKAYVLPEGGSAFVYVDRQREGEVRSALQQALKAVEGIDKIMLPEDYAALGLPSPDADPQIGQLFLTAKAGYAFSGATGGPVTAEVPQTAGSHGYVAADPEMDAIFIASGFGVPTLGATDRVANVDVAPSIAALLGIDLPSAKGKPLPFVKSSSH
jgi:predicted AlkP superfamily pyrophosphatase or phosphodiesterase